MKKIESISRKVQIKNKSTRLADDVDVRRKIVKEKKWERTNKQIKIK